MKIYMRCFIAWIFIHVLKARWIVDETGDLGIRIAGVCMYYYKWQEPLFYKYENMPHRVIHDKEFGTSINTKKKNIDNVNQIVYNTLT